MKLNPAVADFPADMVAACNAALDAGIFYNDQFEAFVLGRMGGFGCEAVLMEVAELDCGHPDHWQMQRDLSRRLEAAVVAAPRGHYVVIRKTRSDRAPTYFFMVSDGTEDRSSVGGSYDYYDALPSGEKVLERMVGYEIYLCRKAIEQARARQSACSAIGKYGIRLGMEFRNIEVGGEKFSTATVSEIHEKAGEVTLYLVRRGSRQRWNATVAADSLVQRAGLAQKRTEAEAAPDLFALV